MSGRTERDTLNTLIETCRDGARGFQLAADHVKSADLKEFFANTALQRERFAAELLPYAQRLGGGQDASGTAAGALHRGWMTIKDALTNYDEDAIMVEAERGEAAAANTYAEAVLGVLPPDARPIIDAQYAAIRSAQRELDELRLSRVAG
ncbi:MAG TPA: PA2169 family four-helix-bundle protein [Vicinamibacterales bacterium]|nr:PA2169 family four-helix-bundle protein [Vicinamibacterales bacterium]